MEETPMTQEEIKPSGQPKSIEFDVDYYATNTGQKVWSHKYRERWYWDNSLCCPNCGTRGIWHEDSAGDYYVGERYACHRCHKDWYLPMGVQDSKGDQWDQRNKAFQGSHK